MSGCPSTFLLRLSGTQPSSLFELQVELRVQGIEVPWEHIHSLPFKKEAFILNRGPKATVALHDMC